MPAKFLSVIAFLLCSFWAGAQGYSYIYLQGDKQTPFYVKLEGEMQPRYGKNYCIIPKLEAGAVNITILFQQNAFPEQHFVILVPENGSRGFMITHKGTDFSLYDLQQQFYLQANNKESDDHLPAPGAKPAVTAMADPPPTAVAQPVAEQPVIKKEEKPVAAAQPAKQDSSNEPKFIDNIELHNDHQSQEPRTADVPKLAMPVTTDNPSAPATPAVPRGTPSGSGIINSDCPQPIDDDKFQSIYQKASQGSEESRLGYLNQQSGNCMNTLQASTLAKMLDSDPAKYTFLKKVYPHITDQANFGSAENIFTDEQWKQYFRQLVHH
ncbi:DUF4476 domain-containing protein [Chitinophagaceae bacterium MMS25-I14]